MPPRDAFVGLDLGVGAVDVVLVGADDGEVLARATRPLELSEPEPLAAEQDPRAWWSACAAALTELSAFASAGGHSILAVGLAGRKHALLALDAADQPLRNAVIDGDGRAVAEAVEVHATVGRTALGRRTGSLASPGHWLPKWMRLRRREPDVASRTARLLFAKDWIRLRLTGDAATDRTEASASLLFDVGRKTWSEELLAAFDVPAGLLPRVVRSSDVSGRVSAEGARETGLAQGLAVVGGAGDDEAAGLSCAAIEPGRVAIVLGASATVIAHHATKGAAGGLAWGRHALRKGYAPTGVVLSAGRALDWVRRAAFPADFEVAQVVEAAAASDPAVGPLVFVPALAGERSPVPDPTASGAFVGLRTAHGRGHLARAVLEGVALSIGGIVRVLRGAGVPVTELRMTAAGARSATWRGLVGAASNVPVLAMGDVGGPAIGAAMLAARSTGRHGASLRAVAARWVRPPPAEAPVAAEVERMSRLDAMLAAARNALRAVGTTPSPGTS